MSWLDALRRLRIAPASVRAHSRGGDERHDGGRIVVRDTVDGIDGMGLGLTIAKHIVEMHGGTIRARSAGPTRGATFIVELPRVA